MTNIQEITETDCIYCAEKINVKAKKCKHCGEILDSTMRELEILKSGKKDIYVTNNAASSATAASSEEKPSHESSALGAWALGTGILTFIICAMANMSDDLTTDDAVGAAIFASVPVVLGMIVLSSRKAGRSMAGWGIALAVVGALSVYGNAS